LPPARPAALDAPATAGAVDAAPAAHAVRAAQADAAQAGAVQAEAAPQPAPAPGGFDLFGFLAGKPRRPAEQPQEAAAPPAGAEEEGRGGRHARGAARDARARALVAALIERHARANGVPVALADAVVRVESRYNAAARNGPYLGLMQIHLNTARAMGYAGDARGLLDPDVNLRYGMKYLGAAYRLAGGDTCGAIMKYQGGHRAVRLTPHAARYCARVRTMMAAR
ncbi:transglycosylase SLT domain-containing protein, partial [Camelimonas abortus]